ncbi:uncharacterized protein LOC126846315 isoform X1 [Adelges cooleyi]|uniref:uncharacterized protein LOC126846315 isoform X1 n=1 Tax=Adelges cooleyi TaxID=133065 RepID=UPI00217F59F4|nr:uncharacterized protein LOC126846315 isoform X1 [Adelges cooleyi]XP_050441584.1 uncharacterized protein LOC126846315 isoform X1 [Adelges cooleyi]
MHFKSIVILCVVYFFTSVWSTGLDESQLRTCIQLYNNRENPLCIQEITNLLATECGIQSPENVFENNPEKLDYIQLNNLFLALAYKGTSHNFEHKMLTPLETDLYLKMFTRNVENSKQPGHLTRYQLSVVFDHLCLNVEEKIKAENVANEIIGDDPINAPEFLLIMFKILPEGNGLNKSQIKEFINSYRLHETQSGSFDRLKIQNIFKDFHMVDKAYEDLMLFEFYRPVAIELMELMLVTAVRSRTVNENDKALSINEVRLLISVYTKFDTDQDGLLSSNEAKTFLEVFYPNESTSSFDGIEINVAEYLMFCFYRKMERNLDIDFVMNKLNI